MGIVSCLTSCHGHSLQAKIRIEQANRLQVCDHTYWLTGTDRPEAAEVAEISLMAVESTLQVAAEGVAISHLAEVRSNKIFAHLTCLVDLYLKCHFRMQIRHVPTYLPSSS